MSFRVQVLGSSSSGNSVFFQTEKGKFLIDVGFSCKIIREELAKLGVELKDLDGVFITHEHTDHSKGAKTISSVASNVKFFANAPTANACEENINWAPFFTDGEGFEFLDLKVFPFSINHDTADPVGYVFEHNGEKMAWLSDCGKITTLVRNRLADVNILFLESNYDLAMLNNSSRPMNLKNRIKSSHGHLSNDDCAAFLEEYENPNLKHLFFVHISAECNSTSIIEKNVCSKMRDRCPHIEIIIPKVSSPKNGRIGF